MGLATAYSITKAGDSKVLILDRYGIGNDYCSSNDVNRVFRYSYGNDEIYTRMAVESLKLWKDLERESGQELLLPTGLLMLQGDDESANGFNEASYRTLSSMKLGAEQLEEEELKKRFPQFRAEKGFFDPHGGVLLASKTMSVLSSLTEKHVVKIRKGQARRIIFGDHPSVETADGQNVRFHKLIITIGPWSNNLLNPKLTSMIPTRQQLIYFKPRKSLDLFRPRTCPVFFTDKHYGLPAAGIDGVKISSKELNDPVDPEDWSPPRQGQVAKPTGQRRSQPQGAFAKPSYGQASSSPRIQPSARYLKSLSRILEALAGHWYLSLRAGHRMTLSPPGRPRFR